MRKKGFVWYADKTKETGEKIADKLDFYSGNKLPTGEKFKIVIGWGAKYPLTYSFSSDQWEIIINHPKKLSVNRDKIEANKKLEDRGISVLKTKRISDFTKDSDLDYPLVARPKCHQGGKTVVFCLSRRDVEITQSNSKLYYLKEWKPSKKEIRLHCSTQAILTGAEKKPKKGEAVNTLIRSHDRGWKFSKIDRNRYPMANGLAQQSLKALGLDFGAIDLIQLENGDWKVLEINTAPSLDSKNLERYVKQLTRLALDKAGRFNCGAILEAI